MKLPLINLTIDDHEETGVEFIALVDTPAIEREWMAFNKQQRFKVESEEKRVVSGPLMVANLPIYRRDDHIGEFYVTFDSVAIEKIVHKFFRTRSSDAVNLMHEQEVDGVYMFESFLIDERKKTPEGFGKLPIGSWFGSFKVENDDVWAKVKSGEFKGFSIEGVFVDQAEKDMDQEIIDQLVRVLSENN